MKKFDLLVSMVLYQPNLDTLKAAIQSVFHCTLKIKLVLIDNSPDPLPSDFLSALQDKRLAYTHLQKNLGFGSAHNLVIREYLHECHYFLVLNPDMSFSPGTLEALAKKMETYPELGLIIPRILNPDHSMQYVNRRLPNPFILLCRPLCHFFPPIERWLALNKRYELRELDHNQAVICPSISGCMMFFRAQALHHSQGFDERFFLYFEDTDLSRRIANHYHCVVFPDITAIHHWQRDAYKKFHAFKQLCRSAYHYFQKHGWIFDRERRHLNQQIGYFIE